MTWQNRIVGHDNVPPDQLLAHPDNWRVHPKYQQEALRGVINDIGYIKSVTVNKRTGRVVDGHLRVTLALRDGIPTIPVEYVELTEAEEAEALLTLDPIAALAGSDKDNLETLLAQVNTEDAAVMKLLEDTAADAGLDIHGEPKDAEPQIDRAAELLEKWQVKTGDLWQIGEHRLICGDCTDAAVVARVMEGEKTEMVFTSPPYNAGNSKTGAYHGGSARRTDFKEMYNADIDDMSAEEYEAFLFLVLGLIGNNCTDNAPVLWNVCYNQKSRDSYGRVCFSDRNPFKVKESIVWDKGQGMNVAGNHILSRTCEFVFLMSKSDEYYSNQNGGVYWNVWRLSNRDGENMSMHGASFPVALPSQGIRQFSKDGAIIYEPFSGSGTTLVACQNLGRRGRAVEISPAYCAVTLERMATAFPELEIKRL